MPNLFSTALASFKEREGRKGCYIWLEFANLVELFRIGRKLRDLVLRLTLDIEHYLKVYINRGAMAEGCNVHHLVRIAGECFGGGAMLNISVKISSW